MPDLTSPLAASPGVTIFAPPLAPIGFYFAAEDNLRLTVYNAAAGVTVELRGRFLPLGGRTARDVSRILTPATDRSASTLTLAMEEGWLIDAQVVILAGTPKRGDTYALLSLVRGLASSGYDAAMIAGSYVTAAERLAFPAAGVRGPLEGPGRIRSITGTDPAVNTEIIETVPTGARWRFIALRAPLVTDATVANRNAMLVFDDGANIYAGTVGQFNQGASLSFTYHFSGIGFQGAQSSITVVVGAPTNIILPAGHRIRTLTGNLQLTDNWGPPQYVVEEWIEP